MSKHKETATSFLKMAGMGKVQEAYDEYVAPSFIHHNQYFKGDRASLMNAMAEAHQSSPNKGFDIKHIYEDGNTVITHSLCTKETMEIAVIHIFRFDGKQIAELWDIGQVVDPESPNENGLF